MFHCTIYLQNSVCLYFFAFERKIRSQENSIMIFLWTIKKKQTLTLEKKTEEKTKHMCPMPVKIVLKSVTELIFVS